MDIKAVVIGHPSRGRMAAELVEGISTHLPGIPIHLHMHSPSEPAWVDFPLALEEALACGRDGAEWVLQFEEDVVLCPDFGARVKQALALSEQLYPSAGCISFFSRSKKDFVSLMNGKALRRISAKSFSMSQCFALQSWMVPRLFSFAENWYINHPQHQRAADLLLADWLSHNKAIVLVHSPSLVQHRVGPSTLPRHYGARQSESYRLVFERNDLCINRSESYSI